MTELFGMLLTCLVALPLLAMTQQVEGPPTETPPADPAATPEGDDAPPGGETPGGERKPADGDPDKPAEPEKVTIDASELRKMQQEQADYKTLQEKHARLKGVAGRQSEEIAAGKTAKGADADEGDEPPAPRTRRRPATFKPDDEGMVTYRGVRMDVAEAEMKRDDDEERRGITARLDAEDQRRKDTEAAQLAQEEADATFKVRQQVADVGVQSAMAVLKIEDKETADVAEFMVQSMLYATAAERKLPLETADGDTLTAILNDEVLPAMERILGHRHRDQETDNATYRANNPAKTGGAPGVPKGKLPSELTQTEKDQLFAAQSGKHDGSAA